MDNNDKKESKDDAIFDLGPMSPGGFGQQLEALHYALFDSELPPVAAPMLSPVAPDVSFVDVDDFLVSLEADDAKDIKPPAFLATLKDAHLAVNNTETAETLAAEGMAMHQHYTQLNADKSRPLYIEKLRIGSNVENNRLNNISVYTNANWTVNLALQTAFRLALNDKHTVPYSTIIDKKEWDPVMSERSNVRPRIILHLVNANLTIGMLRRLTKPDNVTDAEMENGTWKTKDSVEWKRAMLRWPARDFLSRLPGFIFASEDVRSERLPDLQRSRCCPYLLPDDLAQKVQNTRIFAHLKAENTKLEEEDELMIGSYDLDLFLGGNTRDWDIRVVFDARLRHRHFMLRTGGWKNQVGLVAQGEITALRLEKLRFDETRNWQPRVDYVFTVIDESGGQEQLISPAPLDRRKTGEYAWRHTKDCSGNLISYDPTVIDPNFKISESFADLPDFAADPNGVTALETKTMNRYTDTKQQWFGVGINPRMHAAIPRSVFHGRRLKNAFTKGDLDLRPVAPVNFVFMPITTHPIFDCTTVNESLEDARNRADDSVYLLQNCFQGQSASMRRNVDGRHMVSTHLGRITPRIAELGIRPYHMLTIHSEAQRKLWVEIEAFSEEEEPDWSARAIEPNAHEYIYRMLTRIPQLSIDAQRFHGVDNRYFVADCLQGALSQTILPDRPTDYPLLDHTTFNLHGCATTMFWLLMDQRFQSTLGVTQWRWAAEMFLDVSLMDAIMMRVGIIVFLRLARRNTATTEAEFDALYKSYTNRYQPITMVDKEGKLHPSARYFVHLRDVLNYEYNAIGGRAMNTVNYPALPPNAIQVYLDTFRRALSGVLLIFSDRLSTLQSAFVALGGNRMRMAMRAWQCIQRSVPACHANIISRVSDLASPLWTTVSESSLLFNTMSLSQVVQNLFGLGVQLQADREGSRLFGDQTLDFCQCLLEFNKPLPAPRALPLRMTLQQFWYAYIHPGQFAREIPVNWQRGLIYWLSPGAGEFLSEMKQRDQNIAWIACCLCLREQLFPGSVRSKPDLVNALLAKTMEMDENHALQAFHLVALSKKISGDTSVVAKQHAMALMKGKSLMNFAMELFAIIPGITPIVVEPDFSAVNSVPTFTRDGVDFFSFDHLTSLSWFVYDLLHTVN